MNIQIDHTPGPWHFDSSRDQIYADNHSLICKIATGENVTEETANARLIAAAPELLEAARKLEDVFAATERAKAGWSDFAICDLQDALKKVRAVISKII